MNLFLNKIYSQHVKTLKNLILSKNRIIICFSAVPGSGKTTIAKLIEEHYNGVRISNDEIRAIIHDLKKDALNDEVQEILREYLSFFLEKYDYLNKLMILDSGIDRKYPILKKLADNRGFRMIIIKINVNLDKIISRIKNRNPKSYQGYLESMNRWIRENEEFNKNNKADIIMDNNQSLDKEKLFLELDKLIKS